MRTLPRAAVRRGEQRVVLFPVLAYARTGCGKPPAHPIHRTAADGDLLSPRRQQVERDT
jgi:hypothetical protein